MSEAERRLRVAWIGCGIHATDNLLPYLRNTRAHLTAVCDVDPRRAEHAARVFGASDFTIDYRTLLQRDDLDAVMLAVGPRQHYEIAVAALESGLHVFAEKPPAATAAETRDLVARAEASSRKFMTGFMKRYATVNLMTHRIIRDPSFGKPLSLVAQYMTAPFYFEDTMGFLLHHCVHYADLVRHLMGDVREVQVRKTMLAPTRLNLHVNLTFDSGALGFLQMGTIQSRGNPVEWLQIMSEGHRVEVDNVHRLIYYRPNGQKWPLGEAALDPAGDALTWEPNFTAAINQDHKGYANELMHFVDSVLADEDPQPGPGDSLSAMMLLEAIAESAESGEVVDLAHLAY